MQAVLSVFPLPGDRARTGVEQRPKMLEAKTFGAGERSIEFSAARPKTLAAEGVGRRRRKMLPAGREAFPDRNVRCTSLQEAKEFTVAGRERSARDPRRPGQSRAGSSTRRDAERPRSQRIMRRDCHVMLPACQASHSNMTS
jgi:hypothetical protein